MFYVQHHTHFGFVTRTYIPCMQKQKLSHAADVDTYIAHTQTQTQTQFIDSDSERETCTCMDPRASGSVLLGIKPESPPHIYTYMYIHTYMCMNVCMYTHTHTLTYTHTFTCTQIHI